MKDFSVARGIAARLIRQCEGFRSLPYQDSAGVWTIGYGTTRIDGHPVMADTAPISQSSGDRLLLEDMARRCGLVDALIPADASDGQRAAMYSFAYNVGVPALRKSTLLRKWKEGDTIGAREEFSRWNIAGGKIVQGLVNRRVLERAVFEGKIVP